MRRDEHDRPLSEFEIRELRAVIDSATPEDFGDLFTAADQWAVLRTHPKSAAIEAVTVHKGRIVAIKLFRKRRGRP